MSESTLTEVETREPSKVVFSAPTVEVALYAGLVFFALVIRLFILDLSPLNSAEARQALPSWNFVQGKPDTPIGSPLLFTLNAVFFVLFGANDSTARLAPALFGAVLVLLPAFFRRDLGRLGALIVSALLALSPSLVLFSRTLDGVIPAVASALAMIAFAVRYLESGAARNLYGAAASAALAFLSAPDVWTIALALLLYAFASRQSLRSISNNGQTVSVNQKSFALLLFVLVFVGVSTAFLLNRQGMGAAFDLFAAWLDSLRLGSSFVEVVRLLVVYEPLVLVFGLFALLDIVFAPENRSMLFGMLGFWFVTSFLLISFSSDSNPSRIVVTVVPLALLAGMRIGAWVGRLADEIRAMRARELLMHEMPILAVAVGLTSSLLIVLAELAQRGNILAADALVRLVGSLRENSDVGGIIFALLFLVVFVAMSVLAVTTLGLTRAKSVGVAFVFGILSIWTIRQMTMLNFPSGGALNPQEWIVARAASPNVRDLVNDLENSSRWRADDTHTLGIVADSSFGPMLEWNLRDFTNVRFAPRPTTTPTTQALVLTANALAPAQGWISQRYQLEMRRRVAPVSTLRALIFRDVGGGDSVDAMLWIPKPQ